MLGSLVRFVSLSTLSCAACSGKTDSDEAVGVLAHDQASGGIVDVASPAAQCSLRAENTAERGSELWLDRFGDALEVSGVASDVEGNVLLTRSGSELLKLDPDGAPLWGKSFGSLVATDSKRNVYVAGTLAGALQLGDVVLRSKGTQDVYLIKLDPDGNVLYAVTLGSAADDGARSLAVDSSENAVVSGSALGTVKLDANAKVVWTKRFYGHVALDSLGSTWLTGELTGAMDFGGGPLVSAGGADVFVVKLGPSGEHLFSQRFGDASELQLGQAIAVDRWNNVLIGGVFEGAVDFGGGELSLPPGACPAEAWCRTAGFVAKLDSRGEFEWSVSRGPMRALSGLATDPLGNVTLSGALPGGVSPFRIPLLAKLDEAGTELWRRFEWPDTGIGSGHRVAVDPCGDVFWSVSVRPTLDVDEQPYIAKLSP